MKHTLRNHEIIGLFLILLSGTCFGIGLYIVLWAANRPLYYGSLGHLLTLKEYLLFPIFFGSAALFWVLGKIELRNIGPGKRRW